MELTNKVHWKNNKKVDNKVNQQGTTDGLQRSGQWGQPTRYTTRMIKVNQ